MGAPARAYPKIELGAPGLRVLSREPPVYLVDGFLSAPECDALVRAAEEGDLRSVRCSGSFAQLDPSRLWPAVPMTLLSAVPGSLPLGAAPLLEDLRRYLLALAPNALMVGALILLAPRLVETLAPVLTNTSGAQFSGSKWAGLGDLGERHPARRARESLLQRAGDLLLARRARFERLVVTRYLKGQGQAVHNDAYPPAAPGGLEAFLAGGGQRVAQCLVYLNDVPEEDGGATRFAHASLRGLEVRPRRGAALVFFPAFEDGTEDLRMLHSGETYVGEGAKWLIGTWLRQCDVPPPAP